MDKVSGRTTKCFMVLLLIFFAANPANLYAEEEEKWFDRFSFGGSALGYFGYLDMNNNGTSKQFNAAANIEGEMYINERLMGGFQIQAAPGGDDIGFSDQIAITDLYLTYKDITRTGLYLTIGSFDTPFGDQVEVVTNNGDGLRNPFVINSLFFSAWGGTVGTLNTLGAMIGKETDVWDLKFAVTNGTDESASNDDGNLEYVLDAGFNIGKTGRVAGSYLVSDDRNGSKRSGLNANISAYIVDVKLNCPFTDNDSYLKAYFGQAEFGDEDPSTNDNLTFWMVEGKHSLNQKVYIAARYSLWKPNDNNGNGTGISTALASPGIAGAGRIAARDGYTLLTDQEVSRFQVGLGYMAWDNVLIKTTFFADNYDKNSASKDTDIAGGLLSMNIGF